jgi:hypothetical protein
MLSLHEWLLGFRTGYKFLQNAVNSFLQYLISRMIYFNSIFKLIYKSQILIYVSLTHVYLLDFSLL